MIHVFGGIFLDIYINKKEIHDSKINLKIGGSGFNIYSHLKKLEENAIFHGNIGDDDTSETIVNLLNRYNHATNHLTRHKGSSGIITYVNNKAFAVQRGVNALNLNVSNLHNKNYAVITTEIPKASIQEILALDFDHYIIDVGPRPSILKTIKLPKNVLLLGNKKESEIISVDVIKLQEDGAQWDDLYINGNGVNYQRSIGSGDLFTASLIHCHNHQETREECLKFAINRCENYLKDLNKMN